MTAKRGILHHNTRAHTREVQQVAMTSVLNLADISADAVKAIVEIGEKGIAPYAWTAEQGDIQAVGTGSDYLPSCRMRSLCALCALCGFLQV